MSQDTQVTISDDFSTLYHETVSGERFEYEIYGDPDVQREAADRFAIVMGRDFDQFLDMGRCARVEKI